MSNNYCIYHLHTDLSNGVTNVDSVTKYYQYIDKAKSCGMSAIGFSEHGNIFEYLHKKEAVEKAGMKYLHGVEAYVTEKLWYEDNEVVSKKRDNYHCVLIAKNYEGFKELNRLTSIAFNKDDGHFYYNPRITLDELINTSENIIVCTACLGGILSRGTENAKRIFLDFLIKNKDRVFLEIQHHNTKEQIDYNIELYSLHKKTGIRLIAGTDTHCLDERHAEARKMLQLGKGIHFGEEDGWDLVFKTYEELVSSYRKQGALPDNVFIEAIENTNVLADMVEEFTLNKSFKYPKIFNDTEKTFEKMVFEKAKENKCLNERYPWEVVESRLKQEIEDYKTVGACDYMLMQEYLRDWEHKNGIYSGPGRGSCNGSLVCYVLGITEMDSLKFDLNFFRFINPSRISLPDIDTDYSTEDRDRVKQFLLKEHMGFPTIQTSEIITFNTVQLKGAIRDIGRGLNIPLEEINVICNAVYKDEEKHDVIDDMWREKYPEIFEYLDIIMGTIVSIGSHPSGVLITDVDIMSDIGCCTTRESEYPVSCLNMKELDSLNYVKLDILGLDNISLINNTCKLAGIEKITPDNIDLEDWNVWKSIREDTSMIFQWDGSLGSIVIKDLFSDTTISKIRKYIPDLPTLKLFSFGNALIRPCGTSVRNSAVKGAIRRTGIKDIDDMLAPELGNCIVQETIMRFVMRFCGYDLSGADRVRKSISKKLGTEQLLGEIRQGFYKNAVVEYNLSEEKAESIIQPILKCISDATRYAFSWNHSDAYSYIGYALGYLRYYYPVEYITTCLNVWKDKEEKTNTVITYAKKKNIKILPPRFRYSKSEYFMDKEHNAIYKGIGSIKYMNSSVAEELYELRDNEYNSFSELLFDIANKTSLNSRQLEILIKLDFFSEFGNSKELIAINEWFNFFKQGEMKTIKKEKIKDEILYSIIKRYSKETSTSFKIIDIKSIIQETEFVQRSMEIKDFTLKEKVISQLEYYGYVDFGSNSDSMEDRKKLVITDISPMRSKSGKNAGKIWAYRISTTSIGSGKNGEFTIKADVYKNNPLNQYDIIKAEKYAKKEYKGKIYWYLNSYSHIYE